MHRLQELCYPRKSSNFFLNRLQGFSFPKRVLFLLSFFPLALNITEQNQLSLHQNIYFRQINGEVLPSFIHGFDGFVAGFDGVEIHGAH